MPQATQRMNGPSWPCPRSRGYHGYKRAVGRKQQGLFQNRATKSSHFHKATAIPTSIVKPFHASDKAYTVEESWNQVAHLTYLALSRANTKVISSRQEYGHIQRNCRSTVAYLVSAPDPETLPSLEEIDEVDTKFIKLEEQPCKGEDFPRKVRSTVSYIVPAPAPETLPSLEEIDKEHQRHTRIQEYSRADVQQQRRSTVSYPFPAPEPEMLPSVEEAIKPREYKAGAYLSRVQQLTVSQSKGSKEDGSQGGYFYRYPRWMVSPPATAIPPLDGTAVR